MFTRPFCTENKTLSFDYINNQRSVRYAQEMIANFIIVGELVSVSDAVTVAKISIQFSIPPISIPILD